MNLLQRKMHPEIQYLNLIKNIIYNGDKITGRNGNVLSTFGTQMRFPLSEWRENNGEKTKVNIIPFITTKRLAWKTCAKELFWFIRGETDNAKLQKQGVHIWDGNASREFLDSRGLKHYPENTLGPIYGWQWRKFNASYFNPLSKYFSYYDNIENEKLRQKYYGNSYKEYGNNKTIYETYDQLQYVIDALNNNGNDTTLENKYSRRLIVSAWNPLQLHEMALPPCHIMFQFRVNSKDELSCSMYQRSGDVGLGIPFNIASYSLLTHIIAKHCGLKPGEFIHTIGDAHIYEEHIDPLKIELERTPYPFPEIEIKTLHENINDYDISDLIITNYKYHPSIKMEMKA